jgi:signal transduction histidine kinase
MSRYTPSSSNRILFYTLITLVAIAIFMSIYSYYSQLALFKEKELYKLDCIANAVSFKISGDEHEHLMTRYPGMEYTDSLIADPIYMKYQQLLAMTVEMKDISSDMYTLVYDSVQNDFIFGLSSGEKPIWMTRYGHYPELLKEKYSEGGVLDFYEDSLGMWLSAFYPVKNMKDETVAVLQVDESMENYRLRAKQQVLSGVLIVFVIILIIGTLTFFSVKNILNRQEKVATEKMEVEVMRRELLANVSHDLRTPLASIQGYIETILMKKDTLDDERMDKYLNTTLNSTQKLRQLVDELFELSKLEAKERELNEEPMGLGELVLDVTNNFKIHANDQAISLITDIPTDLPQVKGDVALIDRVLQNVIGNSLKFCSGGDEVKISAKREGDFVWIAVEDSGPGISNEDLAHIFDRFSKGNAEGSSGLGLAIVKGILELHEARYEIRSEVGKGTEFRFCLPVWSAETTIN